MKIKHSRARLRPQKIARIDDTAERFDNAARVHIGTAVRPVWVESGLAIRGAALLGQRRTSHAGTIRASISEYVR